MAYTKNALATGATITKAALDNMENGIAAAAERPTSGTASSTTFFRGDGVWATPATGGGGSGTTAPGVVYAESPPSGAGLTAISANGSTDDRSNLQAALDYVKSTYGGGSVILPARTIKCNSGITIPSGVTLRGIPGKTTMDFSGISTSGGVAISSTGAKTYPVYGVIVRGPNGGDKNAYPSNDCTGIRVSGIGVTIRDTEIVGFQIGLDLTESDSFFFLGDNMTIGNCGICVDMNQRSSHNGGSVPTENGERMVFQNCVLYNSKIGFDARGSGVDAFFIGTSLDYLGLHGIVDDAFVHIIGCHLETGYAANNNNWGSMQRWMIDMQNTGRLEISNSRFEVRDAGVYTLLTTLAGPANYNSGFCRLDGTNTWFGALPNETRQFHDRDMQYYPASFTTRTMYSPFLNKWSSAKADYIAADGTVEPAGHKARISAMSISTVNGNEPTYSVTISRELTNGATATDGWIEVSY